jgi:Cdc6-like AAA superfamily ATPase
VYFPQWAPSLVDRFLGRNKSSPLPPGLLDNIVYRPSETDQVVAALKARSGPLGVTVSLVGAGGVGKSALAAMVCADRRIRRRFGMRIYWISFSPEATGAALTATINDAIKLISRHDATFTDPQLAGMQLISYLRNGPRRLFVLDDVWTEEQLAPFTGGQSCTILVTTRRRGLTAGRGVTIAVDQLPLEQARQVLVAGLPSLSLSTIDDLVAVCGRLPLPLRLVNANLANQVLTGIDISTAAAQFLERIRVGGPTEVLAMRSAIADNIGILSPEDAQRFLELGVFAEDEIIPSSLIARLWRATSGMDDVAASALCDRLADLSLASMVTRPDHGFIGLTIHDLIRDFLRSELGQDRLGALNGILIDSIAVDLPTITGLSGEPSGQSQVAWWELSPDEGYLWDHLTEHMQGAGRVTEAEELGADKRWLGSQVLRSRSAPPGDRFASYGISDEFERVMTSREFRPYAQRMPEIRDHFEAEFGAFLGTLSERADGLSAAMLEVKNALVSTKLRRFASRHRVVVWVLVVVALMLPLISYVSFGGPFPGIAESGTKRIDRYWFIGLISSLVLIVGLTQLATLWSRLQQTAVSRKIDAEKTSSFYEQERSRLVAEATRRSVTDTFRDAMVIDFPLLAPTLVELSTAKVVPSRTQEEVRDFIANHDSSAIGIAGPRGSGKSTLMQAVAETKGLATHKVMLTAPVKYEALDFMRRLFREVATEILLQGGYQPDTDRQIRKQRLAAARFRRDMLALFIFFVVGALSLLWALTHETWHWSWTTGLGFVVAGVLVLIVVTPLVSLVGRFVATFRPSQSIGRDGRDPLSVRMAREALEELGWDVEHGQKESNSAKLFAGLLSFSGEDSIKFVRHQSSLSELVAEFRGLLGQFSAEGSGGYDRTFVIFLDELDKIAETDSLIEVINGIKDLMHIPGVHFVVSVSVDALLRFEERGIPARDAFDSTFDTIIRMQRLTLRESLDILNTRAAAFPEALSLACHAWSAGLPRELLRIARRCVSIQRNDSRNLHVAEILRIFVTEDLRGHLANAMRASGQDQEVVNALAILDGIVSQVEQGTDPATALRKIPEPRLNMPVACEVEIGFTLLARFEKNKSAKSAESEKSRIFFETLAAAMAARMEPELLRVAIINNLIQNFRVF